MLYVPGGQISSSFELDRMNPCNTDSNLVLLFSSYVDFMVTLQALRCAALLDKELNAIKLVSQVGLGLI